MTSKRPFKFTTQEYSVILWCIGFLILLVFMYASYAPQFHAFIIGESMMLFLGVAIFFFFLAMALSNYMISKYNLNIFMDRMEMGWEGWLRVTKNRKFAPQIVQTGPLGQEKGLVSGHKADIINRGDFPITLQVGNHAVVKYDLMSHNNNLNEAVGWKLVVHKYGFLGSAAYKRCLEEGKTIKKLKIGKKKEEKK